MASEDDVQLRTLSPRPTELVTPSPARDALKGSLKAAESDLGLKKRKSWFGSMRDVVHKGALQAKAAVDSMRGDDTQLKQMSERSPMIGPSTGSRRSAQSRKSLESSRITSEPRDSLDSAASTTPLKSHTSSPQLNPCRTLSPREAVSSLRQHLHSHRSCNKRASIYPTIGRTSMDGTNVAGPEQFLSPKSRDNDDTGRHERKNSVASSLVGSIRGLARRPTKGKAATHTEPHSWPSDPVEAMKFPSSPINIPTVAPVLGLDLGVSGMNFSPNEIRGAAEHLRDQDTIKLQDPANFGIDGVAGRNSSLPFVPHDVKMHHSHLDILQRPVMSSDMLLSPPSENRRPSPPPPPTTPMPGTNSALELDGADESASSGEKCQVFERSVTPGTQKDRKELRTMCSLDAIADACTTARKDSAVEAYENIREKSQHIQSFVRATPPQNNPYNPRKSIPSVSTVSDFPSDMPALERQKRGDSKYYHFGLGAQASRDRSTAPIPIDDPFIDGDMATSGPPSPTRSVKLPLRLKIKSPSDESAASVEAVSSPISSGHSSEPLSSAYYTFRSQTESPVDGDVDTSQRLQRNYAMPQDLSSIEQRPVPPCTSEQKEILSDDTITRAGGLWNSDLVYPEYDEYPSDFGESSDGCFSPLGGPLRVTPPQAIDSGPVSGSGKSTWKAGLGSDGFRFSIDTWRPGTQSLPEPQPQLTPSRRTTELSIDSGSVDETFETPDGSRASTKSGRSPGMGNKLELDARRSERNMQYNALHQEQTQHLQQQKSSSPIRMLARFTLGGSAADIDPNEAQYFPAYSTAFTSSMEGTPRGARGPARGNSEDSMTMSLRSASDNMAKLKALLGEIDSDDGKPGGEEEIVDAFTTASSPSKHQTGRKYRGIRSDSPSPQNSPSRKMPGTLIVSPKTSSPYAARNDAFLHSFTVLDVEVDIVSSSASDNTTIVDLPTTVNQHCSEQIRLGSSDTLDQTLDMLSSPDSGYRADESSDVHSPVAGKHMPGRYQSQAARKGRKVLGEITGNRA